MGLRRNVLEELKSFFRKKSSPGEPPTAVVSENEAARDSTTSPGYLLGIGDHTRTLIDKRGGELKRPVNASLENKSSDLEQDLGRTTTPGPMDSVKNLAPFHSPRFENTKNSGISVGGGSVNVSNVNSGNTTTVTGTLVQNNTARERIRPGLKLLQKRVASSAFHNSAQRVDPPRCHPNTRVAIQKQIYDWILLDLLAREAWIMWMHGAAGAGKSAIMQSIAELCEKAQIPLASFFFFRTDDSRNSLASFIATLVYQLIQKIPQIQDEIFTIIEGNPLIFNESLESQLEKLIVQPLVRVRDHLPRLFIVFIDGLDECIERAHQSELIKLLGTISHSRTIPVLFLVASRREPQIEAAFIRKDVADLVLTLPLDNSDIEQTSDDIRRFLVDKFNDITETHLLRRYLPANWPATSVVDEIVDKSSGQFIFASVVITYLSSPRANPSTQLDIIRGIRPRDPFSQNPFAHLDALYQHIFSQVEALEKVFDIIAFTLLEEQNESIEFIQSVFALDNGEIDVLFADLKAVILCGSDLNFLHASLPDFLLDKSRSEQYHIDLDKYRTKLLCIFLERDPPFLEPDSGWPPTHIDLKNARGRDTWDRLWAIEKLLGKVNASERLRNALTNFNATFLTETFLNDSWHDTCPNILQYLKHLNFGDNGGAYHYVVDVFAVEYTKYWPLLQDRAKSNVQQISPDLMARIDRKLEKRKHDEEQ